jgi:NADPH2:quinone reductase
MASGAFAPVPPDLAKERRIAVLSSTPPTAYEMREYTSTALALAATGQLRPVIGQVLDLAKAADAHAAIEARETIGKTLLATTAEPGDRLDLPRAGQATPAHKAASRDPRLS